MIDIELTHAAAALVPAIEAAALAVVATDPIEAVRLLLLASQFRQNGPVSAPSRNAAR